MCILAVCRDRFGIVLDKIVRELSDRSFLDLALTERKMFEDLQPALRKRQTRMLMTPRRDTTFRQALTIYSHPEQFNRATSHLVRGEPICFTGCCSPSLTVDKESVRLIQRYKTILRLGDRVNCTVQLLYSSNFAAALHLQVVKSKTCKEHPLQLICEPSDQGLYAMIMGFMPI